MKTCDLPATLEWLSVESVRYIAECLDACESTETLADLRAIFPKEALRQGSRFVKLEQRERLKSWLDYLNQQVA
ncbi:MAG: hypothetical protein SAK29_42840 [Scytonema sp. PMC 1069.18]|nr:hypothetical protein [Scytonema sp. PMC 1069.18]MEC4885299.1 hypothetical protein [Scytonema sp. PMC 1070.18]